MMQMMKLFTAASTQPSQHLLPTRMVEKIVSTQDKQSSRSTSESISSFILVIFLRIDLQVCIRGYDGVTFVTSSYRWRGAEDIGTATTDFRCGVPTTEDRHVTANHLPA